MVRLVLEFLELGDGVFSFGIFGLKQSQKQLCSEISLNCGLVLFLDLSPCKMCLKPPRKVGHWEGYHIYIYIHAPYTI